MSSDNLVIFFVRHDNDFEFIRPILQGVTNSFIVVYGKLSDYSYSSLISLGVNYVSIYSGDEKVVNIVYRIIYKLSSVVFRRKLEELYDVFLLKKLKKQLDLKEKDIPLSQSSSVVFDHINSSSALYLVNYLKNYRQEHNKKIKIVSVPHGIGTFLNNMTDYHNIEPVYMDNYNLYDVIVCNDRQHYNDFCRSGVDSSKLTILPNARYTSKWVKKLLQEINIFDSEHNNGNINILIIHSKMHGNINKQEVVRCLDILKKTDAFNIKIKPHPRGGKKEVENIIGGSNTPTAEIVDGNIIGHIFWADYILSFGSSSMYDAFILNKPILFPAYATSNVLSKDITEMLLPLESPDDFYNLIHDIINNKNPKVNFNHDYEGMDYDEAISLWKDFLHS